MADAPPPRSSDRTSVNFDDPTEKTTFMDELKRAFPTTPATVLHARLAECRAQLKPSENRSQLMDCVRRRLAGEVVSR